MFIIRAYPSLSRRTIIEKVLIPALKGKILCGLSSQLLERREKFGQYVGIAMNDLCKIENKLAAGEMKPDTWERFVQDVFVNDIPGFNPADKGTDWGRDGDISVEGEDVPRRVLITSSTTLDGIRKNMHKNLASLKEHKLPVKRIVLANPALLLTKERDSLVASAQAKGVILRLHDIYGRSYFASKLRRDGHWRKELLGMSSHPITLSREPVVFAESPWRHIPLVGRSSDVATLREMTGDVVMSGKPGTGKSRLAMEIRDAVFIDRDGDLEQVTADVRTFGPRVLVVDDAGNKEQLIKRLLSLRRSESDIFTFRIVATCWIDEVHLVRSWLPNADVFEVDLMERQDIDEAIIAMGVRSELLREEILGQAAGRIGWATMLAQVILSRTGGYVSVLDGRALYGEVGHVLRRTTDDSAALDLLAIIAVLGGIEDRELPVLATVIGGTRQAVARSIEQVATCGLIDIRDRTLDDDFRNRRYEVRPAMLATALVAERSFGSGVTTVDVRQLAYLFPDHVVQLTEAAINACRLGSSGTDSTARRLFREIVNRNVGTLSQRLELASRLVWFDKSIVHEVLVFGRTCLEALSSGSVDSWQAESVIKGVASLAAHAISPHGSEDAVELLLDAAMLDSRPPYQSPGHPPLRVLRELIEDFHPELRLPVGPRYVIHRGALRWMGRWAGNEVAQTVYAQACQCLLSFERNASWVHPSQDDKVQIIKTVITADEMDRVYTDVWPGVKGLLEGGNRAVAAAALDALLGWFRMGSGRDQPFGTTHPRPAIAAAMRVAALLAADFGRCRGMSIGALVRLRGMAGWHAIDIPVIVPADMAPFFENPDPKRFAEDPDGPMAALHTSIAEVVARWVELSPVEVVSKLVALCHELAVAQVPDRGRIDYACQLLADRVSEPYRWFVECKNAGLLPEGFPFALSATQSGSLPPGELDQLLADPRTRGSLVSWALTDEQAPDDVVATIERSVSPADWLTLDVLCIRGQLSDERLIRMFGSLPPLSAGALAAVAFRCRDVDADWPSDRLRPVWLAALLHFRVVSLRCNADDDIATLFKWLAENEQATLTQLVIDTLDQAEDGDAYGTLTHNSWGHLRLLPQEHRLAIWVHFSERKSLQHFLSSQLFRKDAQSLEQLLIDGLMSADDVLMAHGQVDSNTDLIAIARLLVPRGVAPADIAALAGPTSWMERLSSRYEELGNRFKTLLERSKDDRDVLAVARAGVEMFSELLRTELEAERAERVTGRRQ